jgi:hypothetical protein
MKNKILIALFAVLALSSFAVATKVDDIPSIGIKLQGNSSQQYGKIGYDDNGNKYRLVYNNSGTIEYQGEPAFYNLGVGNDYTVGFGSDTSSFESFAGVWFCDVDGNKTIAAASYGLIQIAGYCSYAYVSCEGTAIAIGDKLGQSTYAVTGGEYNASGSPGYRWLARKRAAITLGSLTTTAEVLTAGANLWLNKASAGIAYTTVTGSAQKAIILRDMF